MEMEVRNVYPFKRNDQKQLFKGSLHVAVKLSDNVELNIRSILASRHNDKWFFRMPFKNGTCHKTGNTVTYPILSFTNQELNKALLNAIYEKAPAFIEDFLKNNPLPTDIAPTYQSQPPTDPHKCMKSNPIAKKTTSTEVKPTPLSKKIEWKDPPPRKQAFSKGKSIHSYR